MHSDLVLYPQVIRDKLFSRYCNYYYQKYLAVVVVMIVVAFYIIYSYMVFSISSHESDKDYNSQFFSLPAGMLDRSGCVSVHGLRHPLLAVVGRDIRMRQRDHLREMCA